MAEVDADAAAMIAKIRQAKDGSISVELYSELDAIEKVARLLRLIKDQTAVTVEDVTPRPQDPDRQVMKEAISGFAWLHSPRRTESQPSRPP